MLKVFPTLPPPRDFSPDIPDVLQGVVLKATAKEPAQRYQTAEALVDGLKRSLGMLSGAPAVSDENATQVPPAKTTTPGAVRKTTKKAKKQQRTPVLRRL
jgi:serine/threonine-protein kinase